jgi:hypothetical protein
MTHWLYSGEIFIIWFQNNIIIEHGIVSRWVEVPVFPHGAVILFAMAIGIYLIQVIINFIFQPSVFCNFSYLGIFCDKCYLVWCGFIGRYPICRNIWQSFSTRSRICRWYHPCSVYFSIWVVSWDRVTACRSQGKALFLAFVIIICFHMWSVYTVAYKCKLIIIICIK